MFRSCVSWVSPPPGLESVPITAGTESGTAEPALAHRSLARLCLLVLFGTRLDIIPLCRAYYKRSKCWQLLRSDGQRMNDLRLPLLCQEGRLGCSVKGSVGASACRGADRVCSDALLRVIVCCEGLFVLYSCFTLDTATKSTYTEA